MRRDTDSLVGASLLAKASYQSTQLFLIHRIREQARSHRGYVCSSGGNGQAANDRWAREETLKHTGDIREVADANQITGS